MKIMVDAIRIPDLEGMSGTHNPDAGIKPAPLLFDHKAPLPPGERSRTRNGTLEVNHRILDSTVPADDQFLRSGLLSANRLIGRDRGLFGNGRDTLITYNTGEDASSPGLRGDKKTEETDENEAVQ